jgi:glyoxylase-like metal-dependent hydrolase (beta-lactamase superfamily II)
VLIDPPEGNMAKYLDSLRRLQKLPNLKLLLGGHGPATASPYQKIAEYITHRLERETNILAAVREGASSPSAIVERVYTDVSPKAYSLAERAVIAHLEKLQTEGAIQTDGEVYSAI